MDKPKGRVNPENLELLRRLIEVKKEIDDLPFERMTKDPIVTLTLPCICSCRCPSELELEMGFSQFVWQFRHEGHVIQYAASKGWSASYSRGEVRKLGEIMKDNGDRQDVCVNINQGWEFFCKLCQDLGCPWTKEVDKNNGS